MKKLTHVTATGKASMVDVSGKEAQVRTARAAGHIRLSAVTLDLIRKNQMKKGEVLSMAEFAGIQGAKQTSSLIPLCHPLQITRVDVKAGIVETGITVTCEARCIGRTGIEMEALTGVSIALLTVYDMCKAVDREMIIQDIRLISKVKEDLREQENE